MSREDFGQAAHGFIDAQRAHMRMEVERFFPAALAALSLEDWSEIDGRIVDPDDPVFGSGQEKQFEAVRTMILEWDAEEAGA